MADLDNSARKQLRATYTPILLPDPPRPSSGRAWGKYSFANNLRPTKGELERLARRQPLPQDIRQALERVAGPRSGTAPAENPRLFAEIDWLALTQFGEELARQREEDLQALRDIKVALLDAHEASVVPRERVVPRGGPRGARSVPPTPLAAATLARAGAAMGRGPSRVSFDLGAALEWAAAETPLAAPAGPLLTLLSQDATTHRLRTLDDYIYWSALRVGHAWNYVAAAKQDSERQPVGLLHLERLTFVPAGIERGELVHSVPLSPGEEVNISHKEWTTTSEEFSRIVTDFLEAYSEEGVSEKSELAQSTSSQEQHSSGFNTGVTASGGYGGVTITASMGYTVSESAARSEQTARDHSSTLTRKASARSKKEHKIPPSRWRRRPAPRTSRSASCGTPSRMWRPGSTTTSSSASGASISIATGCA